MKIIMTYIVESCPDSWKVTLAMEYKSVEDAEFDFFEKCSKHDLLFGAERDFKFAGHLFDPSIHFYDKEITTKTKNTKFKRIYIEPRFQTLEDWFNDNLGDE